MDLIIGGRQSGRTTKLIQECAAHKGSVIVCATNHMCDYVQHMAKEMGLEIEKPITFHFFCQYRESWHKNKTYTGFYFDNLDICLKVVAGDTPVYAATTELSNTEILPGMWVTMMSTGREKPIQPNFTSKGGFVYD